MGLFTEGCWGFAPFRVLGEIGRRPRGKRLFGCPCVGRGGFREDGRCVRKRVFVDRFGTQDEAFADVQRLLCQGIPLFQQGRKPF